ncbi:MAG: bifunctional proline dehydrogenase/L-glutamate gamma-semialdehyde dehydrogenase, partial [Myxococcales bacterium]|nr:bifunctional proline dehydrogenase/L-glutamate gamma-semialdehyde dehydrogenase [Myxococcales bacterium]
MSDARKIGLEIFEAMPKQAPSVFRKDFWTGKVMEWSMRDEAFKLEMFRFVDVFPVLRTPEQVAGHLKEYFCRPEQDFPVWIRFGLESVSAGSLVARAAASQIERNIRGMAADFVAGEDAASALPKLIASRKAGIGFTVDLLGEATVSEEEADTYAARYADLIDTLADAAEAWRPVPALDDAPWGEVPRVNVSIKVSSLYSQLDPIDPDGSLAGVRARLLPLLQRARRRGVFVNLDMEQFALKELTLALFRSLVEDPELGGYPHLGVVLQAYLRSARDDARALCAWAKRGGHHITVRLVKGAYWDYETVHAQQQGWPIPVFQNKWESDASFEACAKILLDHYPNVRPAIASHNVRSIAAALAYAEEKGVPAAALEVQTLFGMADALKVAVQRRGVRVREYVPVGELVPGMAYLVRRLLENTSNEGFLRARFAGAADPETLLRDPAAGGRAATSDPTPESEFVNTPNTDFSVAARRESVAAAIGAVRGRLGGHVPLTIGPATVDTEARLERHNPARRSERIVTTAAATREHADQAIRAGYEAFPSWRDRPARERTAVIRRAGELIEARRDEL